MNAAMFLLNSIIILKDGVKDGVVLRRFDPYISGHFLNMMCGHINALHSVLSGSIPASVVLDSFVTDSNLFSVLQSDSWNFIQSDTFCARIAVSSHSLNNINSSKDKNAIVEVSYKDVQKGPVLLLLRLLLIELRNTFDLKSEQQSTSAIEDPLKNIKLYANQLISSLTNKFRIDMSLVTENLNGDIADILISPSILSENEKSVNVDLHSDQVEGIYSEDARETRETAELIGNTSVAVTGQKRALDADNSQGTLVDSDDSDAAAAAGDDDDDDDK
jgi:hypothetical protein